jgi:hypothetical protein
MIYYADNASTQRNRGSARLTNGRYDYTGERSGAMVVGDQER